MAAKIGTEPAAPGRRRFLALAFAGMALLFGADASAQGLNDMRASGAVGEGFDGFMRARSNDAAVKAKVEEVNAKRRAIYAKRAAEQGISADQVGRVYAGEIFGRSPAGTWFLQANGTWTRK